MHKPTEIIFWILYTTSLHAIILSVVIASANNSIVGLCVGGSNQSTVYANTGTVI